MEKEEQIRVQEEWEEEVEEAAMLVRKAKPSTDSTINGSANADTDVTDEVSSNGHTENNENNGDVNGSNVSVTENGGANNGSALVEEEQPQGPVENNGDVNGSIVSVTETGGAVNGSALVEEEQPQGPVEPTTTLPDDEVDKTLKANNEQQRLENCVYYDKDEGIWKCRLCCWNYQTGSLCFDHIQNAKGHLHKVMNGKTFNQQGSCFNFETKGGNFISVFSGEEPDDKNHALEGLNVTSQSIFVEKSPSTEENYQNQQHFEDDSLPTSSLWPSEILHDDHNASQKSFSIKEIESADVDLIEETDLDVAGIDLEKVLQKQNTHDLYCPNCNSCITRRVILRKRKRRIRTLSEDVKRNKPEVTLEDTLAASSLQASSNQGRDTSNVQDDSSSIPAANDYDREREPDLFRCLSCFSFFIPTGNGFKLFRTFGRKGEKPTTQDEQISETNRNWFSSIFASNKGKKPAEQGSANKADKEENEQGAPMPSLNVSNENGQSSSTKEIVSSVHISEGLVDSGTTKPRESAVNGNVTTNLGDKSHDTLQFDQGRAAMDDFEALTVAAGKAPVTNGEYAAGAVSATHQDGLKFLLSSNMGPPIPDKSQADQKFDMEILKENREEEALSNISVSNGNVHVTVDIPQDYQQHTGTMLFTDSVVEEKNTMFKVSHEDGSYTNQVSKSTITTTEVKFQTGETLKANREIAANNSSGKDTIILVETGPVETEASQRAENAIISAEAEASLLGAQVSVVEQRGTEAGESYGIEIMKSIVYGGLVESITSLSVVSSAVGGGAATLNTIALGLANLIGGIFIIGHNLWQLKNDQEDQAINQVTERADKYRELLGRRKNFILHAVVAMLSYLIFGLLPPMIYGFSFRKSDDRELKLMVVAAAAFLCILILAIAKAYVQRPPKSYIGTVIRYIVLGFMVSGVSYVGGELFNRFLEKLGLFNESSSIPRFSHPEMTPNNQAWASF